MTTINFLRPVRSVNHAVHHVIGAITIFDAGEFLVWATPPGGGLKSLIGVKSRKCRAVYDHAMWPVMAGYTRIDNEHPNGYGDLVAEWCNDVISQARLLVD